MVVTRSMTGTKEADTKKKGKANETMVVSRSSMTRTKKTDDKRKMGRKRAVKCKEAHAFSMFMITDFLKRYYQNHPRPTTGMIPNDAEISGNIEWMNMSESEKASWVEKISGLLLPRGTQFHLFQGTAAMKQDAYDMYPTTLGKDKLELLFV